jgi:hypothetical protein
MTSYTITNPKLPLKGLSDAETLVLHDRLADVLCLVSGFKAGVLANPNGNQRARDALLRIAEGIEIALTPQKELCRKRM